MGLENGMSAKKTVASQASMAKNLVVGYFLRCFPPLWWNAPPDGRDPGLGLQFQGRTSLSLLVEVESGSTIVIVKTGVVTFLIRVGFDANYVMIFIMANARDTRQLQGWICGSRIKYG